MNNNNNMNTFKNIPWNSLPINVTSIDIKKVDKQLTHAMHVKDRYVNDTFIDKLTKWYQ